MNDNNSPVYQSINQCHATTGIPVGEIRRARRSGQCPDAFKSHRIILLPLLRWLYGEGRKADIHIVDVAAAKERDLNASAALKEQKKKVQDGVLVQKEFVDKALRETLLSVRQYLLALPSECAHLCNPNDPQHARKELQSWLDARMPMMQNGETK